MHPCPTRSHNSYISLALSVGVHILAFGLWNGTAPEYADVPYAKSAIEISLVTPQPDIVSKEEIKTDQNFQQQINENLEGAFEEAPKKEKSVEHSESIEWNAKPGAISEAVPIEAVNPSPIYPRIARLAGAQGTVLVQATIHGDGTAGTVIVVESSGYPSLDQSALYAIQSWHFNPAKRMGIGVKSSLKIPVVFRLARED
jgi:TonB family protein